MYAIMVIAANQIFETIHKTKSEILRKIKQQLEVIKGKLGNITDIAPTART